MAATGCGRPATRRCRRCGSKPVGTGACQAGSGDQGGVGQPHLVAWCSSNQSKGKWHVTGFLGQLTRVPDLGSFDRQLQCLCPFAFGPTSAGDRWGLGCFEAAEMVERSGRACASASAIPRHMEHGLSRQQKPRRRRGPIALAPSESACAVPRPRLRSDRLGQTRKRHTAGKGKARRLGRVAADPSIDRPYWGANPHASTFICLLPAPSSIIKINPELCHGSRILILAADRI